MSVYVAHGRETATDIEGATGHREPPCDWWEGGLREDEGGANQFLWWVTLSRGEEEDGVNVDCKHILNVVILKKHRKQIQFKAV